MMHLRHVPADHPSSTTTTHAEPTGLHADFITQLVLLSRHDA